MDKNFDTLVRDWDFKQEFNLLQIANLFLSILRLPFGTLRRANSNESDTPVRDWIFIRRSQRNAEGYPAKI